MISSAERAPDLAGTVLEGAYRLVRLIGQGGMGAVYEAIQLRLNKRVAIKLMSKNEVADMVSLMRFHQEAEITSKLGHPHLVNVVDFGTAESGQPYLVMEFLDGEDLDQRLQRVTQLPQEVAARIVMQAASALGAAHAQAIVHRDLKPANIFLLQVPGEPEFVKVLDFGISKIKAASTRRLTGVRSVVGTPSYMSPEQATGRADDTDHRADQWSMACIAWEMLCGHPPFVADDVTALFYQITRIDPPSLLREVPELSPEAEEVLRRALSRRHVDRYPSIRDFARAFESAVLGYTPETTPTPVRITVASDPPLPAMPPGRSTPGHDSPAVAATFPAPAADVSLTPITDHIVRRPGTRYWALVATAVVAVALAAIGISRWQSPAAPNQRRPELAPVASHPNVVELPSESRPSVTPTPVATASPTPAGEPNQLHPSSEKTAKPKAGKDLGPRGHTTGKPKSRAMRAQPKHRLFEEL